MVQNDRHRVAETTIGDDVGHRSERRQEDGQGMEGRCPTRPRARRHSESPKGLPGSKIEAYMRT